MYRISAIKIMSFVFCPNCMWLPRVLASFLDWTTQHWLFSHQFAIVHQCSFCTQPRHLSFLLQLVLTYSYQKKLVLKYWGIKKKELIILLDCQQIFFPTETDTAQYSQRTRHVQVYENKKRWWHLALFSVSVLQISKTTRWQHTITFTRSTSQAPTITGFMAWQMSWHTDDHLGLVYFPNFLSNFTMQKEDSPSYQNANTYMKY
jgi:hypothetical protein